MFSLLLIVLSSAACSGIAARGSVGGQKIDTRVDSEVARYCLASYLAGERGDAALDERMALPALRLPWGARDQILG